MGLDSVELVMEVEETFDITIPDRHAENIRTVGDLYRYVLSRLDGKIPGAPSCLSASAFYRVRRKLMADFRVERRRVRPASLLDDLIPTAKRRAEWRRLEDGLGWTLPDLLRPRWVGVAFLGLLITLAAAIVFAWGRQDGFAPGSAGPAFLRFLIGAHLLGAEVYVLTKPLATGFPTPDVRGLIAMILVSNAATIRDKNPHGWHPHEVWDILVTIVAEQVGVARETIVESTSFVNDLGMD